MTEPLGTGVEFLGGRATPPPASGIVPNLHGVCPERGRRVNPRWVAVWSWTNSKGAKMVEHRTLTASMADYSRDQALAFAAQPEMVPVP